MVYLAEQGLARLAEGSGGVTLDPAWQEMLNHATHRVNQVNIFLKDLTPRLIAPTVDKRTRPYFA